MVSERPHQSEKSFFASALGEIGTGTFFSRYWQRRPFHSRCSDSQRGYVAEFSRNRFFAAFFGRQISVDDVLLYSGALEHDPSPFYKDRYVGHGLKLWDPVKMADYLRSKRGSLIVQGMNLFPGPARDWAADISRALNFPVNCNCYFTPACAGKGTALRAHWDPHDVLIVQIEGRKRWRIYGSPVTLPLRDFQDHAPYDTRKKPLIATTLKTGDTLYIPRGFVHQAHTEKSDSLHLTFSLLLPTWFDLVRLIQEKTLEELAVQKRFITQTPVTGKNRRDPGTEIASCRKLLLDRMRDHLPMAKKMLEKAHDGFGNSADLEIFFAEEKRQEKFACRFSVVSTATAGAAARKTPYERDETQTKRKETAISDLLGFSQRDHFFKKHWQRVPAFMKRRVGKVPVFSMDSLSKAMSLRHIPLSSFQFTDRQGAEVYNKLFLRQDNVMDLGKVLSFLAGKGLVSVHSLEKSDGMVRDFSAKLAAALEFPVTAQAFAWGQNQRYRLETPLPENIFIAHQEGEIDLVAARGRRRLPFTLKAGDILYVPLGWQIRVESKTDALSLVFSVPIPRLIDLLRFYSDKALVSLADKVRYRWFSPIMDMSDAKAARSLRPFLRGYAKTLDAKLKNGRMAGEFRKGFLLFYDVPAPKFLPTDQKL